MGTYQADDEHTAQGDAATVGEAGELDKGTDDGGKSDCQTEKAKDRVCDIDNLLCVLVFT